MTVHDLHQNGASTDGSVPSSAHDTALAFYAAVDALAHGGQDRLATVTTPDFRVYPPGAEAMDLEGFRALVGSFARGFPGAVHDVRDVVAEGPRAAVRIVWRGVHRGAFQGAEPSGSEVVMDETGFLTLRESRVSELRPLFDSATLLLTTGVLAPTATTVGTWSYQHSADTTASPGEVWTIWSDVERWPLWNAGVESAVVQGPFRAGTTILMTPPGEEAIPLQLVEVQPESRFVDRAQVGDLSVTTTHHLTPIPGGGCRVVYRTEVSGPGPAQVREDVGRAVTADFLDVVRALVARAEQ